MCAARETYGYAVCGFGPAGCGFLLHAYKTGALAELVRDGLIIIERAPQAGDGKVGMYQLTGNSLSNVFMDCIDDPGFAPLFDELRANHPAVQAMRALGQEVPPLDLVGVFLKAMTERFIAYLTETHGVEVLLQSEVEQIAQLPTGGYALRIHNLAVRRTSEIAAKNVIGAFGGRQPAELITQAGLLPGVTLEQWKSKLITSDCFLMMSDQVIRERIPLNADGDVVIVGGSHSCFSAVDRLTDALGPIGLKRIIVLHRGPIRLFYASAAEAVADDYSFDDP